MIKCSGQMQKTLGFLLVVAIAIAYSNSFGVPFLFDDSEAVIGNVSIRNIASFAWLKNFSGPVGGRPFSNLTFAASYAVGGLSPVGYHVVNLFIHILSALVIFSLLSEIFSRSDMPQRLRDAAVYLAFSCAVIWGCHPVATYTVTYISQRTEGLMSLCYLLVIYCFWKWMGPDTNRRWPYIAIGFCFCGMMSKEGMATAPIMVLLFDRVFFSASYSSALRQRKWFYSALFASWILLLGLYFNAPGRGTGYDTAITTFKYAVTEGTVVLKYLGLVFYPSPLIFDYSTTVYNHLHHAWLPVIVCLGLVASSLVLLYKRPVWGLAAFWFFLLLAPTSSIIPVPGQPMGENRMYLAALGPIVIFVVLLYYYGRRLTWPVVAISACVFIQLSLNRNFVCTSQVGLWTNEVAMLPDNARARLNLFSSLLVEGRIKDATAALDGAIALRPTWANLSIAKGDLFLRTGDSLKAEACYYFAVQNDPNNLEGMRKLGWMLQERGELAQAEHDFNQVIKWRPTDTMSIVGLGNIALARGKPAEAMALYDKSLEIDPDSAVAHNDRGWLLMQKGDVSAAMEEFITARDLDPALPKAHANVGTLYARAGRYEEAIIQYLVVLRLKPSDDEAICNLGLAYQKIGKRIAAENCYQKVLRRHPKDPRALSLLQALKDEQKVAGPVS